tara:strand:- start:16790 stop:17857 length:1068 start_codon:yes stop_codon:yes gene_type:complete
MNKRKKILFALPNLIGGGAERVLVNIINQVDSKKYKIFLLLLNKQGPLHSCLTNEIHIIDLNIKRTRYSLFKVIKAINKINPNVVFSTTHRMNIIVLVASFLTKNKVKVIAREPNMPSLLINNKQLTSIKLKIISFLYKNAFKIIAQTDEMKKDIVKIYNVLEQNVFTIYNPIDYDFIDKSADSGQDPFNHNYINIVASGRIIDQKAYDVLIKAFKIVIEKNPNFRLYILGDDVVGLKQELLELVEKLKLDSFIFFEGFVKNPYSYYKYSDLFVLSSRWEGLPNTVLENLYLEKPIVVTDCINYLSDLIINGENGFIVPVNDYKILGEKILNYNRLEPKNTYIPTDINVLFSMYI